MSVNKFIKDPLWATLVGTLVAAMVVSFVVFVQSGEATPQAADERTPYASLSPLIVGGTAVPNGKYPFVAYIELYQGMRIRVAPARRANPSRSGGAKPTRLLLCVYGRQPGRRTEWLSDKAPPSWGRGGSGWQQRTTRGDARPRSSERSSTREQRRGALWRHNKRAHPVLSCYRPRWP